ncbi:ABC transporter ATP-binding protein [Desulfuribacillus stibiiarsenatis]|uniref:ABC transporter ATP-binding protein n=1 Tax=Desulfuribacillus stibiiarsenatis TaxID=1390249 RepID=A0A1E5L4K8_9FIRM|nr:ABC transporter ATP-binding protein [Desulfuribacillus stibiiarsenatis]OEH84899.1 ABC transporter ATP-binding protein [Desulfuribacillus stibiiarsenatis]
MTKNVLEIINLQKKIKDHEIVKGITLSVKESEVFGFLGHNGAGKTTTIRMIMGLIKPTAGTVKICGYDIRDNFTKAMEHVGCIIESPDMYKYMSGTDNLKHFANMYGNITQSRIDEVVELVGLTKRIGDKVEEYSTGMCQRLGLAQAILSKPKLLILDEPTNGLDPSGIREFRELIIHLAREEKMGVFVSSHILSEIQLMCQRVAVIQMGEVLTVAEVSELIQEGKTIWELDQPKKAQVLLESKFGISSQITEDAKLSASISPQQLMEINQMFVQNAIQIAYVSKESESLEEIFLHLTKAKGETIAQTS